MPDWIFPTAFSSWTPGDESPEDQAYKSTYLSGRLTMYDETRRFEHDIAQYHNKAHAIAVNSDSSANLIAVCALKHLHVARRSLTRFDDDTLYDGIAVVPAIAWSTTYAPLLQHRYDLHLLDVDDTWNAIPTPEINGIDILLGCSILGNPADFTQIPTLEDNCESLGARDPKGALTGTSGLLSTGSGFYSHQLSAIELGWILTDDDDLAHLCRILRNHGNQGFEEQDPDFDASYNFTQFGYNVRPIETHAAVARVQLDHLDDMIAHRVWNLSYFRDQTFRLPIVHPRLNGTPSPFSLHFQVESTEVRSRLVANLRQAGIDCRLPTGGSFSKHPYGKPWRHQPTPRADAIHETGLFLGNAPRPIPELIDRAVKVMRDVLITS